MPRNLFDLLQPADAGTQNRIHGVVVGIVTNNEDPDNLGRVRVRFPWLSDEDESWWARMAVPMAGNERGAYFLPEVNDEVLVAFEHGDMRFPYVLGALWNGKDKPPVDNSDGKNNIRVIKSRSGHIIRLDDSDGAEKIEIIDSSEKNHIVIDTAANTITVTADADITLESVQGKIVIKGAAVEIESTQQDVKIKSAANVNAEAGAQMTIKGATVNIN